MKECPKCHKKFDNDIKFCPVCGYKDDDINKKDNDEFKICPKCNKSYPYLIDHCFECGYSTQTYRNRMKKLQEDIEKPLIEKNIPKCPICGSTAITAGQRGFSIITGFLGSNKTVCRCANCGYSWKPGK